MQSIAILIQTKKNLFTDQACDCFFDFQEMLLSGKLPVSIDYYSILACKCA